MDWQRKLDYCGGVPWQSVSECSSQDLEADLDLAGSQESLRFVASHHTQPCTLGTPQDAVSIQHSLAVEVPNLSDSH